MAKKTIVSCDRCSRAITAEYDQFQVWVSSIGGADMMETVSSERDSYDLCRDCHAKLEVFFTGSYALKHHSCTGGDNGS